VSRRISAARHEPSGNIAGSPKIAMMATRKPANTVKTAAAHDVAEFGCRPGRELSVPQAVDQTGIVEDFGETIVVCVIHKLELTISTASELGSTNG
jgi:hypothetical protein